MPRVSQIFASKSYKGAELDRPIVLTISAVEEREFDEGVKLVASFRDNDRELVLNRTNSNTIADDYGDDTDSWIGRRVKLYKAMVDYQGRRVAAVRVMTDPNSRQEAAPESDGFDAPAPERGDPGPDDSDLPF